MKAHKAHTTEAIVKDITIGADPEFFVRKGKGFISGHTFACGTKEKPMATENGHIQVDGMALEINVTPAKTKEEFIKNAYQAFGDLRKYVRNIDVECEVVAASCVFFGTKYLSELPPGVTKLGCEPDYCAYAQKSNVAPNEKASFRTGAGHIHIGWTEDQSVRDLTHFKDCCAISRQLDYYLGLPSLLWDNDGTRRKLYGRAGSFRPKPYGLEYRVLSNKWMDDASIAGFVFDRAKNALEDYRAGIVLEDMYGDTAKDWINGNVLNWDKLTPKGTELAKQVLV